MTGERIARAARAQALYDEFIEPLLDDMEAEYTARIVEVANTELHPANRSDKIATLSNALRIASNIRAGLKASIMDGEIAQRDKLRAENVERLSDAQQRLLKITGY